ncbi:MAG: hypothetical protein E6Y65_10630, partial [Enterococcus faecium]|nr:hypothetical protein [Enterococcus faecium]
DKSGKSEMENYLALVAIILKAVCGLASLEGAFRCSKIKQAISTKKKSRFVHLFQGWGSL